MRKRSGLRIAYWVFPPLLTLVLYWPGLMAWFQKDDFAWLGLRDMVHSWRDLGTVLFAPMAQGTVRTLSERVFFLSFTSVFGLQSLPFRLWVFLTGIATVTVLSAVCTRLTRSRAAGFWAAIFWITNSTTAFVFSWTAIYYELLCGLFFLVALWLLIRYAETGDKRFYRAQWAVYLTGFLVLELNVVYPALALAYALCCARGMVRKVLPMFVPAALYSMLHVVTAPLLTSGPYKMFWDASMASTLWTYWKSALGPNRLIYLGVQPSVWRSALAVALMAGLAWVLLQQRSRLAWFFAAWFVIVLAPLLPLRDHISDYYLTIPTLGLAMWGGWAVAEGWRASRGLTTALAVLYLGVNIPVARISCNALAGDSQRIRRVIEGVVRESDGTKIILLKGVDRGMFLNAFVHKPLRLYGGREAYLVSDDPAGLPAEYFVSNTAAQDMVREGRAVMIEAKAF